MVKKDNLEIAKKVLMAVGGVVNIQSVTHCVTSLRFVLKDMSIPKDEELQQIQGVLGVNRAGGQYQVIIGTMVTEVYDELVKLDGIRGDGEVDAETGEKNRKK